MKKTVQILLLGSSIAAFSVDVAHAQESLPHQSHPPDVGRRLPQWVALQGFVGVMSSGQKLAGGALKIARLRQRHTYITIANLRFAASVSVGRPSGHLEHRCGQLEKEAFDFGWLKRRAALEPASKQFQECAREKVFRALVGKRSGLAILGRFRDLVIDLVREDLAELGRSRVTTEAARRQERADGHSRARSEPTGRSRRHPIRRQDRGRIFGTGGLPCLSPASSWDRAGKS